MLCHATVFRHMPRHHIWLDPVRKKKTKSDASQTSRTMPNITCLAICVFPTNFPSLVVAG
jgi:hypothetical protein